jgi:hypothetical protein
MCHSTSPKAQRRVMSGTSGHNVTVAGGARINHEGDRAAQPQSAK